MDVHIELNDEQERDFRKWARDNYKPDEEICPAWHPVVVDECKKINEEDAKSVRHRPIEHRQRIRDAVENYLDEHAVECNVGHLASSQDTRDHIIEIGTSILCTKWGVSYAGGSFAQAVVDNNLSESFGRADMINRKALYFYSVLLYNMRYIE